MSKRPTLDQVLAGADRATERVQRWPNWMLELSPNTAHLVKDEPMSEQSEPKCVVCREPARDYGGSYLWCNQCWNSVRGGSMELSLVTVAEQIARSAWDQADKQIAALQARIAELEAQREETAGLYTAEIQKNVRANKRIAELEAQLANTLEARAARTKQPWPARLLLEFAAKYAYRFTREDFDRMLEDVKGESHPACSKCLHPVCECL